MPRPARRNGAFAKLPSAQHPMHRKLLCDRPDMAAAVNDEELVV
jgi:hypothetical protein